jgi:hypothetical protein
MSYAWMKSQAHAASAWFARKVAQLCPPLFDRTPYVLLDGAFAYPDREFEQFATNSLGAPETIAFGHIADEIDLFRREA